MQMTLKVAYIPETYKRGTHIRKVQFTDEMAGHSFLTLKVYRV